MDSERPTHQTINEPVYVNISIFLCGGSQGDIDNYVKRITHGLNKIAYDDDRQILIVKFYFNK
ncbi:RusA family crossover junction endodeoxyribonuclease [Alteribacillus sp. HJP-4]|uniref:RusA family crossover junction endodeoxyribonuclease n=1 Tax=Alteribacillus sp. HJP-4 TaxID=2775394 RepID=UPI0035CD0321